jgi:hypothetical protein
MRTAHARGRSRVPSRPLFCPREAGKSGKSLIYILVGCILSGDHLSLIGIKDQ